jgi:hypothetical protein
MVKSAKYLRPWENKKESKATKLNFFKPSVAQSSLKSSKVIALGRKSNTSVPTECTSKAPKVTKHCDPFGTSIGQRSFKSSKVLAVGRKPKGRLPTKSTKKAVNLTRQVNPFGKTTMKYVKDTMADLKISRRYAAASAQHGKEASAMSKSTKLSAKDISFRNLETPDNDEIVRTDMYDNLKLDSLNKGKRSNAMSLTVMKHGKSPIFMTKATISLCVDEVAKYLHAEGIDLHEWRTVFRSK